MDFTISDDQRLVIDVIDEACRRLRPVEDKCYLEHRLNDQAIKIFKDAHILGLPISSDYGDGQNADALTYALAIERIGQEGAGVHTFFSAHVSLGQIPLQRWGTNEQKEMYLPKTTTGDIVMAFGLTEPAWGSEPTAMETSFDERDGAYYLRGQKAWISNGSIADLLIIFARPKGKMDGITAFLVERDFEGFTSSPIKNKMGIPTSDTAMLYFDNCRVPKENMLGSYGKGMNVAYSALLSGRLSAASGSVGVAQDCLNESVRYAKERIQHKKKIGKHQLIQREIARTSVELEAARLLTYKAAMVKSQSDKNVESIDLRNQADWWLSQAKYSSSNAAFAAADRAVQILGANGYSFENRPARHLVDTRVIRIYEGTDQILEQKIALGLLGREYESFS